LGAGLLALAALWLPPVMAQISPDDLLPVEDAFSLSAAGGQAEVELRFTIAEGYYLYRHAFRFEATSDEVVLGAPGIPDGERGFDDFFGEIESYRDGVTITLPVTSPIEGGAAEVEVAVRFQGCADLGVCYPPHRQVVSAVVEAAAPPRAGRSSTGGLDALLGLPAATGSGWNDSAGALPEEEAFEFEAIAIDPTTILVRLTSAPAYYLYRHTIDFEIPASEIRVAGMELPEARAIRDEYFGDTEVYYDQIEIPVRLERPAGPEQRVELVAAFQGCLTDGICYPPMTRSLEVMLPSATADDVAVTLGEMAPPVPAAASAPASVSEQDELAGLLGGSPLIALPLFFVAGILLAFTPCVFPMVPILSGLIAGAGDGMTTAKAFRLSLVYVLAMALVYTGFGVVAGVFGQNLQAIFQHPWVLSAFAILFVLLSLSMFGFYELQIPASIQTRLNALSNRAEGGTLLGAAIMGALSALVVGPCVAAPLMGALIYIGQTGDAVLGGAALFSMAIGMGVPLMIWGTSAGGLLPRAGVWMVAVKAVFGVGLLALAIWMLERVLPGAVIMLLWGALAIACAMYLLSASRGEQTLGGWQKLWRGLGAMLLIIGAIQFVGALSGGQDWLRPLHHLQPTSGGAMTTPAPPAFERIDSLDQLQARIADSSRPVFLDFYADWCVDCVRMERRTFPDPAVAERMQALTLLKVDVTDYNDEHRSILGHFGLIGPPAYLFFDSGDELRALRTFGFMPPPEFTALLDRVLQ
jgi:thiol:disulfide interchange protein DsbD